MDETLTERFLEMVEKSSRIVFFGGAGVSTESGIPDYRSEDGLYSQKYHYPPETMLSSEFLHSQPEEFFRFYRDKMMHPQAKPNITHEKLAHMEAKGKLLAVVTQNVDGLHQLAGSKTVDELHGSVHRNYCAQCGKGHSFAFVYRAIGIPRCESCGGIVRPDVVLYGEQLNSDVVSSASRHIAGADMLIIGGTSLAVYPAASFVRFYAGERLVVINKTPLMAGGAAIEITGGLGSVFSQIQA